MSLPEFVDISSSVAQALDTGAAVVALESTIITHGMPAPQNIEMAREVESVITKNGAVPATIAVLDGTLKIGLDQHELEQLANAPKPYKLSRADIAFAISQNLTGGTTVAATMLAAKLAGIQTFATGGIGGAHRGSELNFDISADLGEMAQTPVIVVCAGAKAILDLEKTFEILETNGVPVITYGQDNLPAFWSRDSSLPSPLRLDQASAIADFFQTRQQLGLRGGVIVANPIPAEDEIPSTQINQFIAQALQAADSQAIKGKDVTPFLLQKIFELSNGDSLKANMALVKNNAELAAKIAVNLTR